MKIYGFDNASQGLEVGFASSETNSQNPDNYTRFNFDVDSQYFLLRLVTNVYIKRMRPPYQQLSTLQY